MSITQILLCTFFCNWIFPPWFLIKLRLSYVQQATRKTDPTAYQCIWDNWDNSVYYLHKNIIIALLGQYGLFTHTCVSKNATVYNAIFYLFFYLAFMHITHFLNSTMVNLLFYCLIKKKWLLMRNVANMLPMKSELSGKISKFQGYWWKYQSAEK